MKALISVLSVILFSTQSFAAPTAYELAQGLVTIMNANNEADGPFEFLVCQTDNRNFANDDFSKERSVSEFLVMRKGGDIEGVFQVNYSVVTSYAYVAESITRLNARFESVLACPSGTSQVYKEKRQ